MAVSSAMMRAARAASRGRSISASTPMNEMYMVQASMFKFSIADCRLPIAPHTNCHALKAQ
jgi:hypothetical protein